MTIYGSEDTLSVCPLYSEDFERGHDSLYERTGEAEVACVKGHSWKVLEVYKDRSIHWFKLSGPI